MTNNLNKRNKNSQKNPLRQEEVGKVEPQGSEFVGKNSEYKIWLNYTLCFHQQTYLKEANQTFMYEWPSNSICDSLTQYHPTPLLTQRTL